MGQLWSHYLVNEEEVGKAFSMFNQKKSFMQSDIRGKHKTAFQPQCRNSWEGSPKPLPLPFQRPSLWASYLMAWADIQLWTQVWQKAHKTINYIKATRGSDSGGHKYGFCSEISGVTVGSAYNLYNEHPVPAWPLVLFFPFYLMTVWSSLGAWKKKVLQSWLTYIDSAGGNIFTQPQKAAAQLSLLLACALLKQMQI